MHINKYKDIIFAISIAVAYLHIFRNISSLYFGFYFISAIYVLYYSFNKEKLIYLVVYIAASLYLAFLSAFSHGREELVTGFLRFIFVLPYAITLATLRSNENLTKLFLIITLYFIIISGLTILYQTFYGEILWFAESGWRSGVKKFSSLAGNSNAFGSLVGIGILINYKITENKSIKLLINLILIISAIASLQKMSIITSILALLFQYFSLSLFRRMFSIGNMITAIIILILYFIGYNFGVINEEDPYIQYATSIFGSNASEVGDVSVSESMIDRFTMLPSNVISYWGSLYILIGVGFYGAGGVLGYPEYPMAHNLVVEIYSMFGFVLGSLITFMIFNIVFKAIKVKLCSCRNTVGYLDLFASIYLITIVGGIFTGGVFYHPVSGIIFWSCIGQIYVRKEQLKNEQKKI